MELTQIVAENLRMLRKYFRITQVELAQEIGHTSAFVSQVERGLTSMRVETIESIAQVLGVESELFFRKNGYLDITKNRDRMPVSQRHRRR